MKNKLTYLFLILSITILFNNLDLYSNQTTVSCNSTKRFFNTLKGKDFLNYTLQNHLITFFAGTEKAREENYYSFLISLAWEWRKLGITSSIIKNYKIVNCLPEGDIIKVKVIFYFHYFLWLNKKVIFTVPFTRIGNKYLVNFSPLSSASLE